MNILVGEVPLLERPFMAFVRLTRPIILSHFTEVPVPTRFIFLYLEPRGAPAPPSAAAYAAGASGTAKAGNCAGAFGANGAADGEDGAGAGGGANEGGEMNKSESSLTSSENAVVPTTHFREMGRCFATLMSDEIFHIIAYRARDREDLIAGFEEFLNNVTVLPPGEWDPSIRIEPPKSLPSQVRVYSTRLLN